MQLARKITLPLALSAFLALGFSAWLSVREAVELHHADIERDQGAAARVFLAALERERQHGTAIEGAAELLAVANRESERTQWRMASMTELNLAAAQRETLAHGDAVFVLDVWHTAQTWIPTTLPDGAPGALWVQETLDAERDIVGRIIGSHVLNFGTLGVLWAVVAIGLGAVVIGRPMRSLAAKARKVSEGDYSGHLNISQHDEIGQLANEMNHMCDELLVARDRLRQEIVARSNAQDALRHADRLTTVGLLAAGIAHELGTPLNVVSMRARMISTGEIKGVAVNENADIIHAQAAQMTRVIVGFSRRAKSSSWRMMRVICAACCYPILSFGTDEQKHKYLIPLARGEKLGAFCLSEPKLSIG